jgi:ABC-type transport system involved in cytochrome bd biosynthesis fused ATPase/permease subunit
VTSRLSALLELSGAPRGRVALAGALGALTVLCGVGLMATAGYLISRAAERPAILSLTVAIVGVRFFGLARPVVRYLERLTSHDLAFRVLGRTRARMYERIEPLAPVQLSDYRQGDLLSRLVADVDALQNLHLRGSARRSSRSLPGRSPSALRPPSTGRREPCSRRSRPRGRRRTDAVAALGRRVDERTAARRGELAADLVELLRGAPELVVYGREDDRLARLRAADRSLVGLARRAAFADGLGEGLRLTVCGATVAGVLAVAVSDHAQARSTASSSPSWRSSRSLRSKRSSRCRKRSASCRRRSRRAVGSWS